MVTSIVVYGSTLGLMTEVCCWVEYYQVALTPFLLTTSWEAKAYCPSYIAPSHTPFPYVRRLVRERQLDAEWPLVLKKTGAVDWLLSPRCAFDTSPAGTQLRWKSR